MKDQLTKLQSRLILYLNPYNKRDECNTQLDERPITANPTWGDIFESSFKAQSSKLERLFSLKHGKRDVRALSIEL